jgi:hypothetical protein
MKRKYKLNIRYGGIYSNVVIGLQYIAHRRLNLEDCYLNISGLEYNPLDYILDQELAEEYQDIHVQKMPTYHHKNRVDQDIRYYTLKKLANELPYKKEILGLVDKQAKKFNINENTIGIHIRLSDMNILHGNLYGYTSYEDYVEEINKEIEPDSSLFIASDNFESIKKLQRYYGKKVNYVPGMIRGSTESENTYDLQLDNFIKKDFWVEAFVDMLLLAKCTKLICRTSNLANMSIITSNTFQRIIMI